jgi:hypothetical protein
MIGSILGKAFRLMRPLILIALIAAAVIGCTRKPQAIHPAGSNRYQVAEAALCHMMDEYSRSDGKDWSAYVIDGGEFTPQLVAAFANYSPKVIANIQIEYDTNLNTTPIWWRLIKRPVSQWNCGRLAIWKSMVILLRLKFLHIKAAWARSCTVYNSAVRMGNGLLNPKRWIQFRETHHFGRGVR